MASAVGVANGQKNGGVVLQNGQSGQTKGGYVGFGQNYKIPRTTSVASLSGPSTGPPPGPPEKQENAKSYEEWGRYFGKIDGRFSLYFYNDSLTDVTFVIEGKKIRGHKIILSACSWEFYIIFNLLRLDKKNEVTIQDTTYEVFLGFLEYCYTGWTLLSHETTWEILKLGYRFNVKPLINLCEGHLTKRLTTHTCLTFYTKGEFLNDTSQLKAKILEVMQEDVVSIFYNKQFNNLPLSAVRELVASRNLNCDEIFLFEALVKWAKYNCVKNGIQCIPKNFRVVLKDVFFKIRFPRIPAHLLFEILAEYPGILTEKEISNIAKISTGISKSPKLKAQLQERARESVQKIEISKEIRQNQDSDQADRLENNTFRIFCYQNYPEKNYCHVFKSSVIFKCETPLILCGFGFFANTAEQPKIASCVLHHVNSSPTIQLACDVAADEHKLWKTHLEFYYHESQFVQKRLLKPEQWYSLFCTLRDKAEVPQTPPIIALDELNKVHFRKLIPNVIPYLIFERVNN